MTKSEWNKKVLRALSDMARKSMQTIEAKAIYNYLEILQLCGELDDHKELLDLMNQYSYVKTNENYKNRKKERV